MRQASVGPYFVDFLCREHSVLVEVDGGTHSTAEELAADALRTAFLEAQGFRVFRAHNSEIYDNLDGVCDTLLNFILPELFTEKP
jgi:very-short-patch-repair endonuclease